jgi:hypothetical protein
MSAEGAAGTVISYPVPLFANLPIHEEYYIPQRFVISAVGLGTTTTVTTTEDHDYVIGQECRLIIPPSFGCRQLNGLTGFVISIPATNQVVLNIDSSRNVDAYIASTATTVAQILAIGDVNLGATNSEGRRNNSTFIPGSFINISPI